MGDFAEILLFSSPLCPLPTLWRVLPMSSSLLISHLCCVVPLLDTSVQEPLQAEEDYPDA